MMLIQRLIDREGGYVNSPNDPGGETKYGISKRSYPQLDIFSLTRELAEEIILRDFVRPLHIEQLPEPLQEAVLDWAYHSGISVPVKFLQRLIDVPVDGIIGRETINKLRSFPPGKIERLRLEVLGERLRFLARLINKRPTLSSYLVGWVNRVTGLL